VHNLRLKFAIFASVSSPTISAISNRDYALVQGCLLSIGLTYVLVNTLTDVVYRWVNPRMRG
jgi:peptide/nickel transport system permease protein